MVDTVLENEIKDRVLDPQSSENPKKALAEVLYKQRAIEEANEAHLRNRKRSLFNPSKLYEE